MGDDGLRTARFLMIGNSPRSDILPVLELGGCAILIPNKLTWGHENTSKPPEEERYFEVEHLGLVPDLIERLAKREGG